MAKGDSARGIVPGGNMSLQQMNTAWQKEGAFEPGMQRMGQMGQQQIPQQNQNMWGGQSFNSGMFGNMMPPQQGMMQQPPQTSMMQPPGWSQGLAGSGLMDHIRNLLGNSQTVGTGKGGLWF